jgi:hypothetical protein
MLSARSQMGRSHFVCGRRAYDGSGAQQPRRGAPLIIAKHLAGPGGVNPEPRSRLPEQFVTAAVRLGVIAWRDRAQSSVDVVRSRRDDLGPTRMTHLRSLPPPLTARNRRPIGTPRSVLAWLAQFEPQQAQVIADIVRRAAEAATLARSYVGESAQRPSTEDAPT